MNFKMLFTVMRKKGVTFWELAKAIKCSELELIEKIDKDVLNNKEIKVLSDFLNLSSENIGQIFFNDLVS